MGGKTGLIKYRKKKEKLQIWLTGFANAFLYF
jgi:hypothetical protein